MKRVKVPLFGLTGKAATVNADATEGATVGADLYWPDGSVVTEAQLKSKEALAPSFDTTDDIEEGQFNEFFTAQRAQDAVGGILVDTESVKFEYDPTVHTIKAFAATGFLPYLVPDGTVFVVPENAQALWTIPIELEGDAGLEIDGALVEVN